MELIGLFAPSLTKFLQLCTAFVVNCSPVCGSAAESHSRLLDNVVSGAAFLPIAVSPIRFEALS